MSDPPGNSPSKYHHLSSWKPSHICNIQVIDFISSMWEDESIDRLENNQWKCPWCNVISKGINATKYLAHVIGTKFIHIKRCIDSVSQAHLSRYKYLHIIKAYKKGRIIDCPHKMIASISRL